jgi:hypothetical protein
MNEQPRSIFKTVLVGYAVGAGIFFLPMFFVVAVPSMIKQSNVGLVGALSMLVVIPLVLIIQGAVLGWLVTFGWWLVEKVRGAQP